MNSDGASPAADARVAHVVQAGAIRAALAEAPIIATRDAPTGELRGVAVDLARELARRLGVALVEVPYPRPGAVMAGLAAQAWDIAFLGIDPARAAQADFTPPYLEAELRCLVAAQSAIRSLADVDRPGIRIAVPRGDLVDVLLGQRLRHAALLRADTVTGAFGLLQAAAAEVCALPLPNLLEFSQRLPGSRILDERFGVNSLAMALPKGQGGLTAWCGEFIEAMKASGFVRHAIERAGLEGVQVAPPASAGVR